MKTQDTVTINREMLLHSAMLLVTVAMSLNGKSHMHSYDAMASLKRSIIDSMHGNGKSFTMLAVNAHNVAGRIPFDDDNLEIMTIVNQIEKMFMTVE